MSSDARGELTAERWERAQTLFHAALALPDAERVAFVARECSGDDSLRALVLGLLREDASEGSVLDHDVAHVASMLLGDAAPLPPHTAFGPYHITGLLGEGGMGVVYLAERDDLGSRAAIKILRDAWLSPARRARFAAEQRTLAALSHTSIARLYDAGTLADGTPWIVMEYVQGVPLTAFCDMHSCSTRARLALFRAVCEAVLHAHGHAIIHRDLKPSNILVTADGDPKLLDFGISRQLDTTDAPADRTRTDLRLMTPAYAAPEQLAGGTIGVHTDVYSLGVILYELLAGQLPFDLSRSTPGQAEAIVAAREPERPSVVVHRNAAARGTAVVTASRAEWGDLDVICLTAMRKEPERRYLSVEALLRDIDHYLRGEPLEARPDSRSYRVAKFVRRNARAVAAASAVLAIIIALVTFYTVRLTTARNAALAEAARTNRIERFMVSLFEGGDAAAGPAESLRVVTLVDRGAREARGLAAEPVMQAELYGTLGGIYQTIGQVDRADTLLSTALAKRRALYGAAHPDVAASLIALGLLRSDQARFDEAERLVREGLENSRRALPPDHPQIARATTALGLVLENRGSYDKAIPVLEEAVRLESARGSTTPELATALKELADTHFYLGHYATADSLNHQVLAINRALFGDTHPHIADDYVNLGAVQYEWGHYREAEQYYRRALRITETWYGRDNVETASTLTMLARALVRENRLDAASPVLHEALATQERVFGRVHPRVASALNEIGTVALQRKQLDEADSAFRRMGAIYRAVYGDHHYLIAVAVSNLASVYVARQEYARAEPLYREAVRRFTDTQGPDHANTGIALVKLGRSLLRQRRYAEAEAQTLAGYAILMKQTDPASSYLRAARTDLIVEYDSLRQASRAAKFRAELAAMDSASRD